MGEFYKLLVTKCVCRKPAVGGPGGSHEYVTLLNHEFQGRYVRYSGTKRPTFKFEVSKAFLFMVEFAHIIRAEKLNPILHPSARLTDRKGKVIAP